MRKILTVLVIGCSLCLSNRPLWAEETRRQQLAEKLLLIMKVDEQIKVMFEKMKVMGKQQMQSMSKEMNVPLPQEGPMQDEITDAMAQEMSWDNLKNEFNAVYADVFTEEELQGLIDFYQTPVGQKWIEKMPELMTKSMTVNQGHTSKMMSKIKAITDKYSPKAAPNPKAE